MSDDPTEWFRPRGKDEKSADDGPGQTPTEPPPTEAIGSTDAGPATQPLSPNDPDAPGAPDPTAAGTTSDDGLSDLFGDQRDYSQESDWLPPRDAETPTQVQPTAPATDPLGWLGGDSADDATTVALGAGAAGAGAAGIGAAGGATGAWAASDDAVTQRFDAGMMSPPTGSTPGGLPPEGGSRRLVIALAIVGAVLVIALVLLLVFVFTGSAGSPTKSAKPSTSASKSASASPSPSRTSASPTPSTTPSATPTATQAPPPTVPAPTISSFSASPSTAQCTSDDPVNLSFSWSTSNAAKVSISIDGVKDPYNDQLSAAGTLSNVPFDCTKESQGYTLLATNSKGQQVAKQLTIARETSDTDG